MNAGCRNGTRTRSVCMHASYTHAVCTQAAHAHLADSHKYSACMPHTHCHQTHSHWWISLIFRNQAICMSCARRCATRMPISYTRARSMQACRTHAVRTHFTGADTACTIVLGIVCTQQGWPTKMWTQKLEDLLIISSPEFLKSSLCIGRRVQW
jgi:hypothetical protein